jgi:glycosyltransferase involved in cell wall biosynthesis
LKVAFVLTRADELGGAQVHVRDLAEACRQRGHAVRIYAGGFGRLGSGTSERAHEIITVPHLIRPINPIRDFQAFVALFRLLKDWSPDVIAAHSSKAGLLARAVARSLAIPAVFTAHGWAFTEGVGPVRRAIYWLLERIGSLLSGLVIAVSDFDRNLAIAAKITTPERIRTVHNGIPDLMPGVPTARLRTIPPKVIMVARFSEQKDHECLLRALARIRESLWSLTLVGAGDPATTKDLARSLGLLERVYFLGERTDVEQLLSEHQVFVLASRWEGFPISILEAMRAGLPVVASDVGGVSEAVINGHTGFLCERGDSEQLAQQLRVLIESPESREAMGRAARMHFLEHFTIDKMVTRTLQLYETAIERQ